MVHTLLSSLVTREYFDRILENRRQKVFVPDFAVRRQVEYSTDHRNRGVPVRLYIPVDVAAPEFVEAVVLELKGFEKGCVSTSEL